MQYRIASLLWTVYFASVYTFSVGCLLANGKLFDGLAGMTVLVVIAMSLAWLFGDWRRRQSRDLGTRLLVVRPPATSVLRDLRPIHFVASLGALGIDGFLLSGNDWLESYDPQRLVLPVLFSLCPVVYCSAARYEFCELGVKVGEGYRWDECRFELRRDEAEMVLQHRDVDCKPIVLDVPRSRLDEIAAILDEHQPPAEA